jgi:c-di-GMP-related signal transduction protein
MLKQMAYWVNEIHTPISPKEAGFWRAVSFLSSIIIIWFIGLVSRFAIFLKSNAKIRKFRKLNYYKFGSNMYKKCQNEVQRVVAMLSLQAKFLNLKGFRTYF